MTSKTKKTAASINPGALAQAVAQALRQQAEQAEQEKPEKPDALTQSNLMLAAVETFVEKNIGEVDGLLLIVDEKGRAKDAFTWHQQQRVWAKRVTKGRRQSIISDIYHGIYAPELGKQFPGYPLLKDAKRDQEAIEQYLATRIGRGEEALEKFDGFSQKGGPCFMFSDKGVCQIRREGAGYKLYTGLENDLHYYLRTDIDGGLPTDEEYAKLRPALIEMLRAYAPYYDAAEDDAPYYNKINKRARKTITGNYFLDDLFLHLASAWVPVDIRPVLIAVGASGNGKSALFRQIGFALGSRTMNVGLHAATFTTGTEECKGPRLLKVRYGLLGYRIAIALDGDSSAVFDNGFIKNFAAVGELNELGGLHTDSIFVDLKSVGGMCTNDVPRNIDDSGGTDRRQRIYKFRENFLKQGVSQLELAMKFEKYYPALRRLVFEFIEQLVEVWDCKLPAQHPMLQNDWRQVSEISRWSLRTDLGRFFVRVPADVKEDDFAYRFRRRQKEVYKLMLGSSVNDSDSLTAFSITRGEKDNNYFNGVYLVAQISQRSGGGKNIKQSAVKALMERMGRDRDSRGYYSGYVHTLALVEFLQEFYGGNKQHVVDVLRSLYAAPDNASDDDLLDADMQALLNAKPAASSDNDDSEQPWADDDDLPPDEMI